MDTFRVTSGAFQNVQWSVLSMVGEEAVSELFSFTIEILALRHHLEEAAPHDASGARLEGALTGQTVLFRMQERGLDRYGIIAQVRMLPPEQRGGVGYARARVEVVPRAWLLTQRRNTRIFQHLYVHQIVSQVLLESGIRHRWQLLNVYPKRVYCTQYDETDYEFVTRLLAEEGILFFFEHGTGFNEASPPINTYASTAGVELAAKVLGGASLNLVGELLKPKTPEDEADDPSQVPSGFAGPAGDGDVFVFIDQPLYPVSHTADSHDAILALVLRDHAGLLEGGETLLSELVPVQRIRPRAIEMRDYDFRKPMLALHAKTSVSGAPSVPGEPPLDVYTHHGEYEKPEVNVPLAGVALEQLRADALVLSGRGTSPRLAAGYAFDLHDTTASHVEEGRYAITRVRHEAHAATAPPIPPATDDRYEALIDGCARVIHEALLQQEPVAEESIRRVLRDELAHRVTSRPRYQNRFECVPASMAYRPPRPRRIIRNVTESATVVGPLGSPQTTLPLDPNDPRATLAANEIYTDRLGRVKVQFHWDREGMRNENSSCWIRVVQNWAGAGFGFQFIPRVGMEVLVTFLGGDLDRPVIVGSLYNATHATPEPLPQRVTRSGIRTQSSPGGGGFNELSFDDATGLERVYVHAQKDFEEMVNDTHTLSVKNHQKVSIAARQDIGVGGSQTIGIGNNRALLVGNDLSESIQGNRTIRVGRNDSLVVQGNLHHTVDGVSVRTIKTDDHTRVEGDSNVTVHGSSITQIGGKNSGGTGHAVTFVQGNSYLTASERVVVKSERGPIRLECGDSFVELTGDTITLNAKTLALVGTKQVTVKGNASGMDLNEGGGTLLGPSVAMATHQGSEIQLDGAHATMSAPGMTTVQGQSVNLKSSNSQSKSTSNTHQDASKSPNLHLTVTHRKHQPDNGIAGARYRILADDEVHEGTTGTHGDIHVWVPPTANVAVVTLWANERHPDLYPRGPLVWLLHLVRDLATVASMKGARIRLRNLSYDPGTVLDDDTIDGVTQQALLEFQLDQDLPPTGVLDQDTQNKLKDTYGAS